jgi:amino acid permease
MRYKTLNLICWVFFSIGFIVLLFSAYWNMFAHTDPSQFYITTLLSVNVMVTALVGYIVLKHSSALINQEEEIKKINERHFEFEGWVRDMTEDD